MEGMKGQLFKKLKINPYKTILTTR